MVFILSKMTPDGEKAIKSSDVKIGDVIKLKKNDRVPADMILLKST